VKCPACTHESRNAPHACYQLIFEFSTIKYVVN
jgi:hypothetical protein